MKLTVIFICLIPLGYASTLAFLDSLGANTHQKLHYRNMESGKTKALRRLYNLELIPKFKLLNFRYQDEKGD